MDSGRAVDEYIAKNGWTVLAFPLGGKSSGGLLSAQDVQY